MSAQALQFAGSLVAIVLLALFAWWLGLGQGRTIGSEQEARTLAAEAEPTFTADEIVLGSDGKAALIADRTGSIMLLFPHGSHFVGRILGGAAKATCDGSTLTVLTGERVHRAIAVPLDDDAAQAWRKRIEALG